MTTIILTRTPNHGNEWRITTPKQTRGISDLNMDHWYYCAQGAFIRPGMESKFIDQARAKGIRVIPQLVTRAQHNRNCYQWAVAEQGFKGTYTDWNKLRKAERAEYERGAGKR